MKNINNFSIKRTGLLIKRNTIMNLKAILINFGSYFGILTIIALVNAYSSGGILELNTIANLGVLFIFVSGYWASSKAYAELRTSANGQFFLTLPATNLEKLLSHWFLTSILFIVVANIALFLTLTFNSYLTAIIFGSPIELFNPLSTENITMMGKYIVTQSPFLLGAIYFRRNNFTNTLLWAFVFIAIITIWTGFTAWILFDETLFSINNEAIKFIIVHLDENLINLVYGIFFWGLVMPFFLTVSYFALKEKEL